jgi:hypothetical protein
MDSRSLYEGLLRALESENVRLRAEADSQAAKAERLNGEVRAARQSRAPAATAGDAAGECAPGRPQSPNEVPAT